MNKVYNKLLKKYGKQGWWPLFNKKTSKFEYSSKIPKNDYERLEICLGAILTQGTNWKNVEKSLLVLIKNDLINIDKLDKINEKGLALLIKSSGYYNQKAKKLKALAEFYLKNRTIIPKRKDLLSVWGIGKETADSILLYVYKEQIFVIDSYTKRIFSRLGLCNENISYDELQSLFHNNLNKDYKIFNEYHALLVEHAKRYCKKIPECLKCPLNKICSYYKNK